MLFITNSCAVERVKTMLHIVCNEGKSCCNKSPTSSIEERAAYLHLWIYYSY